MSALPVAVHAQARIAAVLAMAAGYVDAYGYLTYNTYVSFMSGNTTQAGMRAGAGNLMAAFMMMLAILFFIIGVAIGTLVAQSRAPQSRRMALGLVAVLFACVIAVTRLRAGPSELPIVVLTLAMGILNTALSNVGAESVSLTFVTGTVARIGNHLAFAYARARLTDAQGSGDTHPNAASNTPSADSPTVIRAAGGASTAGGTAFPLVAVGTGGTACVAAGCVCAGREQPFKTIETMVTCSARYPM